MWRSAARVSILLLFVALGSACTSLRTHGRSAATAVPSADLPRGKLLFEQQCAACHATQARTTTIGPSLAGERARRSFAQIYAIVLDPAPPMPKLYPSTLTKRQIRDIAAYVESL